MIEQRAADGAAAGIDGVLEYSSDLFDAATVEALGRRLIRLLAAAWLIPSARLAHCDPGAGRARHHPAALERHRAADRAHHPA